MNTREIVKKINEIGNSYLNKHSDSFFSRFFSIHTNHPIALRLKNYSCPTSDPMDCERFLLDCYYRLPKYSGEIATAIENIMHDELDRPITSDLLITSITYENLKALGADFMELTPSIKDWYSDHTKNIKTTAEKLIKCDKNNHNHYQGFNRTYQKVWLDLVSIYSESLPHENNKLIENILTLIANTFQISIKRAEAMHGEIMELSPSQIAYTITQSMKQKFLELNKGNQELSVMKTNRP